MGMAACSAAQEAKRETLAEMEARRRRLLNLRLPSYLMDAVLDFIYRPEFADELPPIMRCFDQDEVRLLHIQCL